MNAHAPADGVILAAGSSARAGTFKPALEIGGKPMVERCLEDMLAVCSRVIVVGGHSFDRLCALVEGFPGVECIENRDYQKGMFTSVKAGLACVRADACFVLPVDAPLVPAEVYRTLAGEDGPVRIPTFGGRRGHPLFLMGSVIPAILREPDSSSLREFIQKTGFTQVPVASDAILLDIDSPEDHARLVSRLARAAVPPP